MQKPNLAPTDQGYRPITALTYYRWSLLLPLLVPVFEIPVSLKTGDLFLFLYLVFGGASYALWAICALVWSRGKDVKRARRLSFWAPVQIAPFLWLGCVAAAMCNVVNGEVGAGMDTVINSDVNTAVHEIASNRGAIGEWAWLFVLYTTPVSLIFGYLWVAVITGLLAFLKLCGVVRDALV